MERWFFRPNRWKYNDKISGKAVINYEENVKPVKACKVCACLRLNVKSNAYKLKVLRVTICLAMFLRIVSMHFTTLFSFHVGYILNTIITIAHPRLAARLKMP
ncbi:hypothetical protein P9477_14640 [Enterobacter mori]|uniref:hypothetical protein n=1 Tax=Enterobacter mori TaxID=539813 RepID=UPI00398B2DC9